jgi:hypothetical protein
MHCGAEVTESSTNKQHHHSTPPITSDRKPTQPTTRHSQRGRTDTRIHTWSIPNARIHTHAIEADVVMGGLFQRNGSIHGNARVFGGIAYGADTSYREHILSRSCSAHIPFRSYGEHIPMSEVAEASHAEQKHIQSMCGVWCQ